MFPDGRRHGRGTVKREDGIDCKKQMTREGKRKDETNN